MISSQPCDARRSQEVMAVMYLDVVEVDLLQVGVVGLHLLQTCFHICGVWWLLKYWFGFFTFDNIYNTSFNL